jgi:2-dehydropantoate 2-reductase
VLDASGFSCRPDPAVMRWKYAKLLMNLNNALGAVCTTGREVADIAEQMRDEAMATYRAAGIEWASAAEMTARREGLVEYAPVPGAERGGSSSWQSLARGTGNIEVDHLNGEIVLLGRLHGVATPANEVLQRLAAGAADRGEPPGSISPERLRSLIDAAS